jgi:hypothetical protein
MLVPQPTILELCLRSSSVTVSSKGKKNKGNKQQQQQKTPKYPKFKCNTVSVSPSACSFNSVVVSSKEGKKKNRV